MKEYLIFYRLGLGTALLAAALALQALLSSPLLLSFYLISYFILSYDVFFKAFGEVKHLELGECFLMCLATVGAFLLRQFPEAVAVMLLYQIGEVLSDAAAGRAKRSIGALYALRPDTVTVISDDGASSVLRPEEVSVGTLVQVKPGEKIPLDCVVLEGESEVDFSALTGESEPHAAKPSIALPAGVINLSGVLLLRVSAPFSESAVAKILRLTESALEKKSKLQTFTARFARFYTPVVVFLAALLAFGAPLFFGWDTFSEYAYRALTFLVISCPCAFVISIPLTYIAGLGAASRRGILIKGAVFLDALAKAKTVVFDKTGTLTDATLSIKHIHTAGAEEEDVLENAVLAQHFSSHPIALSLRKAWKGSQETGNFSDGRVYAGEGVSLTHEGNTILAGNADLMRRIEISVSEEEAHGSVVYVVKNGLLLGHICLEGKPKKEAAEAIQSLRALGVSDIILMTGDNQEAGAFLAKELGLDRAHCKLLPEEKALKTQALVAEKKDVGTVLFVGDGINDSPSLASADVGIAMGTLGTPAAIESADMTILDDDLKKVPLAIKLSRRIRRIAIQNTAAALGIKVLFLFLGTLGISSLWEAVFADVGVTFLAVLNAMRAAKS